MAFIVDYAKNWALDTAGGYLKTGLQAGGTLAGNTVGGIGSTIENSGRAFGEGSKSRAQSLFSVATLWMHYFYLSSTVCQR